LDSPSDIKPDAAPDSGTQAQPPEYTTLAGLIVKYLLAPQSMQAVTPLAEKSMHAVAPLAVEYLPAGQLEQDAQKSWKRFQLNMENRMWPQQKRSMFQWHYICQGHKAWSPGLG